MPKHGKTYLGIITAAIFILMEVAALGMLRKSSALQDIWINRMTHRVLAATWGSGEKVRGYFSLEKQNAALAQQNYELFKQLQRYKAWEEGMNSRMRLDSFKLAQNYEYIAATITKISRNSQHNYIILDKGSEDGVREQSAIVTNHGVVGMVYAVDRHYSYGLTLMNDKINVSARIGDSGVIAPLSWDGRRSDGAVLKDIPLHYSIATGDTVRTSGYSMIYPPDIPLGVTEDAHIQNGSYNVVNVRLFEDLSSVRYVIICNNPERGVIEELEQQ